MYLGEVGQCVSVALLWWESDRNGRWGFLKGKDGVRWSLVRMELGEVVLRADLSPDWQLLWAGDWADFRSVWVEVFVCMLQEDFFNAPS
jgi:hypothetical protein